jgi:hypothetical protein
MPVLFVDPPGLLRMSAQPMDQLANAPAGADVAHLDPRGIAAMRDGLDTPKACDLQCALPVQRSRTDRPLHQ